MTYRARIYICASFMGYIDCESWELKKNPFRLYFYDNNGNFVGHVQPFGGLTARVEIYKNSKPDKRKEGWVLSKQYAFRNKGDLVLEENYKVDYGNYKKLLTGG